MAGNLVEFTDANFELEVLKSDLPVLVDFWAPWCGPCRMIGPSVEALSTEYAGKVKIGKLNTDDQVETAAKYGIRSIPTLLIFKGGEVVNQLVGALPKPKIAEQLDKVV
jgi:thioredoxin 1